jgi:cell division protein FtsZ
MQDAGSALMGVGTASGEKRAEKAALQAINSPLLEVSVHGAKGVLFAISGGDDITIHEIQEAAKIITESIDKDAKVIFGTIRDEKIKKGEIRVTVIATSFSSETPRKNLFGATGHTILKEDNAPIAKKEIQNTISQNVGSASAPDVFNKKPGDKKEDEIIIEDDGGDWSAVPAFLRRNKK